MKPAGHHHSEVRNLPEQQGGLAQVERMDNEALRHHRANDDDSKLDAAALSETPEKTTGLRTTTSQEHQEKMLDGPNEERGTETARTPTTVAVDANCNGVSSESTETRLQEGDVEKRLEDLEGPVAKQPPNLDLPKPSYLGAPRLPPPEGSPRKRDRTQFLARIVPGAFQVRQGHPDEHNEDALDHSFNSEDTEQPQAVVGPVFEAEIVIQRDFDSNTSGREPPQVSCAESDAGHIKISDAVEVKKWNRKNTCLALAVLVLTLSVGLGMAFAFQNKNVKDDRVFDQPGTTTVSTAPSLAPATLMEQDASSQGSTFRAFETADELADAVDAYLALDVSARSNSSVTQEYGWPIGTWNVSRVTDFELLFSAVRNPMMADFNEDISLWDVSSATTMGEMFFGAAVFNGDLSLWNVSSVEKTRYMFRAAHAFRGDGLDSWDVSKVTDMSSMFANAFSFNADLSMWDTSRVIRMHYLFAGASAFDQDLSGWNVSKVEVMNGLFNECRLFNSDISNWDVSRVQAVSRMFKGATAFDQDLSSWQVGNVRFMAGMFANATSFAQNLCPWGLKLPRQSEITSGMFWNTSCEEQEDPNWSSSPPGPFCSSCDHNPM